MAELAMSGYIVLFVFFAVLLSIVVYEIRKVVKLPVSPMLMIAGILLRVIGPQIGDLKGTVEMIDEIDHYTVLLIFMPALIFETSFGTDWYTFKREIWQILPLATTAVVLSAIITAFMFKYILLYDLTWSECMLFGTMLSATDHVAVVAQLKEIHASHRFELLIQGETLLNEGTVMVLLFIFLDAATGDSSDASYSVLLFLRLTAGGLALGFGFAIAMIIWLKRVVNDHIQETNLTLVTTYLLFWIAEETKLHASGAIATVTFGLIMSAWGKTVISPTVEDKVHSFWLLAGHNIEALVFMIGGMLLGSLIVNENHLEPIDIGLLFIVFILIHAIRAIVILVHYPILKSFGYGLTIKEAIVLTLAGLKGAIAITLALLVYHHDGVSTRVKTLSLFMVVGISALSIFFDSLAVKYAVRTLGMEKLSSVQENMMINVTHSLIDKTIQKLEKMRRRPDMRLADWDTVIDIAGAKNLLTRIFKTTRLGSQIIKDNKGAPINKLLEKYKQAVIIEEEDIIRETRRRFLTCVKGIYWHLFEEGQCMGQTALILMESSNRCLDRDESTMHDWEFLEKEIHSACMISIYSRGTKLPLLGKWFKSMLNDRVLLAYDVASSFIHAHHEAEELIDQMGIDDVNKELFEQVMHEVHYQVHLCEDFINKHITDNYPQVLRHIQTQKAFHKLLNAQRNSIVEIYKHGVIGEIEYDNLLEAIDNDLKQNSLSESASLPSIRELLNNRFPEATIVQVNEMIACAEQRVYEPGEKISIRYSPTDGATLILSGRIRESSDLYQKDHPMGDFVAMENLLPCYPMNLTDLEAVTPTYIAKISPDFLHRLPEFEKDIWEQCVARLLILFRESLCEMFREVDGDSISEFVSKCECRRYDARSHVNIENGGILVHGSFGSFSGMTSIPPDAAKLVIAPEVSVILHFPSAFAERIRNPTEPENKAIVAYLLTCSKLSTRGNTLLNQGFGLLIKNTLRLPSGVLNQAFKNLTRSKETGSSKTAIVHPTDHFMHEEEEANEKPGSTQQMIDEGDMTHPDKSEDDSLIPPNPKPKTVLSKLILKRPIKDPEVVAKIIGRNLEDGETDRRE
jgi:NhaP-type Na+/H+ or K+/H+ antiporter